MIATTQRKRGMALLVVIGAMALLILLFVAVAATVQTTHTQTRLMALRQSQNAETATLVSTLTADASTTGSTATHLTCEIGGAESSVSIQRTPLAPDDALYAAQPALRHRPGDALASVSWEGGRVPPKTEEYLINTQGRRDGAVYLGQPES